MGLKRGSKPASKYKKGDANRFRATFFAFFYPNVQKSPVASSNGKQQSTGAKDENRGINTLFCCGQSTKAAYKILHYTKMREKGEAFATKFGLRNEKLMC